MHKTSYYIVNGITIYRILAAFILFYLIQTGRMEIFRWLLAVSFFTDFLDGFLARKFKAGSTFGSRIDSIADDLTVLMAIIGLVVFHPEFVVQKLEWAIVVFILYLLQTSMALIRYGRISSFHTYLAKCAALLQGLFFILFFFLPHWPLPLFYVAIIVTILDLIEEIILVLVVPKWQTDVKGWYWVSKKRKKK